LRDEALPLFAAADDRAGLLRPEDAAGVVVEAGPQRAHALLETGKAGGKLRAVP
jgi:hypothetical protein